MMPGLTVFVLLATVAEGQPMSRIVVRDVSQDLPAGHFGRKPRTIYRIGTCCVRLEEEKNPETGLHLVFITRQPDIWILDREQMLAGHTVDTGPVLEARVPVLDAQGLDGLEFGHELAFMKSHDARRDAPITCAVGQCAQYELEHNGHRIALLTATPAERPVEIRLTAPQGQEVVYVYDAYETGLTAKPDLFALPPGARVMKQPQEQPQESPRE